jgi:transcriptional regulator with XRE-family HTH domain
MAYNEFEMHPAAVMPKAISTSFATEVGKRLKAARIAAGHGSAAVFAGKIGVSPQRYNNWETGDVVVPPEFVPRIFLLTRVDSNFLYLGDLSRLPGDILDKIENPARQATGRSRSSEKR